MREKLGGGLIGEAHNIRETKPQCWRTAFHRKRWVPVSRAGKTWKEKVAEEIKGWEKDEEEHWGQEEVSEKEVEKELGGMSKDGSPGNDLITARMLWEAGPILWKRLAALFTKYLKEGGVPKEFKKDVIVPLFKRGDRYWAKNYRPVSLMSVGAKLIQRILYARVLEWDKQKERGLTGPYNFGSVKGRDRHMVLWVLNVVCAWKMGREGGSTIVALWDANNAYPSIWQNGVDWLMYKGGVRGRLWKILRDMERGLESQVRVNGNMIKIKRHERGANQGAVAPPHRWKFIMAEWLYECERREMGTEMGGERIPGLGYVR
jgi:hypothetical protein